MPYGFIIGVLIQGALVALTLAAPRRPRWLAGLAYRVAAAYSEAPFLFVYLIAISAMGPTAGRLDSAGGWVALGLAFLVALGLLILAWRGAGRGPSSNRPWTMAWGRDGAR